MHDIRLKNKGSDRLYIDLGEGNSFFLNPNQTINSDVMPESVFYKYSEVEFMERPQKPKLKMQHGYQKPRATKGSMILEIMNEDSSLPTHLITINEKKIRLQYGLCEYVRFDFVRDVSLYEARFKKIIFQSPVTRKRFSNGVVFHDKISKTEYVPRDQKELNEIDELRISKRKGELGV